MRYSNFPCIWSWSYWIDKARTISDPSFCWTCYWLSWTSRYRIFFNFISFKLQNSKTCGNFVFLVLQNSSVIFSDFDLSLLFETGIKEEQILAQNGPLVLVTKTQEQIDKGMLQYSELHSHSIHQYDIIPTPVSERENLFFFFWWMCFFRLWNWFYKTWSFCCWRSFETFSTLSSQSSHSTRCILSSHQPLEYVLVYNFKFYQISKNFVSCFAHLNMKQNLKNTNNFVSSKKWFVLFLCNTLIFSNISFSFVCTFHLSLDVALLLSLVVDNLCCDMWIKLWFRKIVNNQAINKMNAEAVARVMTPLLMPYITHASPSQTSTTTTTTSETTPPPTTTTTTTNVPSPPLPRPQFLHMDSLTYDNFLHQ